MSGKADKDLLGRDNCWHGMGRINIVNMEGSTMAKSGPTGFHQVPSSASFPSLCHRLSYLPIKLQVTQSKLNI